MLSISILFVLSSKLMAKDVSCTDYCQYMTAYNYELALMTNDPNFDSGKYMVECMADCKENNPDNSPTVNNHIDGDSGCFIISVSSPFEPQPDHQDCQ